MSFATTWTLTFTTWTLTFTTWTLTFTEQTLDDRCLNVCTVTDADGTVLGGCTMRYPSTEISRTYPELIEFFRYHSAKRAIEDVRLTQLLRKAQS